MKNHIITILFLLLIYACGPSAKHDQHAGSDTAHSPEEPWKDSALVTLINPTNAFVVSSIPVTAVVKRQEDIEIEALGSIAYDTRYVNNISSRVEGRIEKLYVRYRFQQVKKGQKIMEVYSPELVTAQEELLFLTKQDPDNQLMIQAAKQKLINLGMETVQVMEVVKSGKAKLTVTIYSPYSGHIHESGGTAMNNSPGAMKDLSLLTEELSLKEGMYLRKGQSVFTVFDPGKAWAVLNIYDENQALVKVGNPVRVVPETAPDKDFRARLDVLEPFYRKDQKTMTARVYFNNSVQHIPIGSQVRCTIFGNARDAQWLPKEAVLTMGLDKVVFLRSSGGFRASKVTTGVVHDGHVQIKSGLSATDSVAVNAQYLMDSESFIKVNKAS
jgi:Cu(I)/Ag(I) efflux system membrane fusion protein